MKFFNVSAGSLEEDPALPRDAGNAESRAGDPAGTKAS
jgi:hypothetical protein